MSRRTDKAIKEIQKISAEAGEQIKKIVLEGVKLVEGKFPKMIFGVALPKNEHREGCVARGTGEPVDVTVRAVGQKLPAIELFRVDAFWTKALVVVLTPFGIFECGYVMTEPSYAYAEDLRRRNVMVLVDAKPDWERKREGPDLWVKYGVLALQKLEELKRGGDFYTEDCKFWSEFQL